MIEQVSWAQAALGLAVISIVAYQLNLVLENARIKKIGARAGKAPTVVPLSLDVIYKAIRALLTDESLEFWQGRLRRFANPANPFTLEDRLVGKRFVFTADPENLKAI